MAEVDPYAFNAAALTRVHRLTDALVGAEAQVVQLQRELHASHAAQEEERERTEAAEQRYRSARDRATRYRRRLREVEDQEEEEVGGNGASTCDYAEAVGEAVRPENVSG